MTPNPPHRGRAGLAPLPARGAGCRPSVPPSRWGPAVLVPAREQRAAEPDQAGRAGTGERENMCPAPAQHLLSLQQGGEGQDHLQGGGAGLPSSKLFPGGTPSLGNSLRALPIPSTSARSCSWGSEGRRARPPGTASPAGQGGGRWPSLGTRSCAQPESQAPLGGREGRGAELSFPLVATGAAPCLCGQRPAKSGAGALPKMVKARGAGLAAAQSGHAC